MDKGVLAVHSPVLVLSQGDASVMVVVADRPRSMGKRVRNGNWHPKVDTLARKVAYSHCEEVR